MAQSSIGLSSRVTPNFAPSAESVRLSLFVTLCLPTPGFRANLPPPLPLPLVNEPRFSTSVAALLGSLFVVGRLGASGLSVGGGM